MLDNPQFTLGKVGIMHPLIYQSWITNPTPCMLEKVARLTMVESSARITPRVYGEKRLQYACLFAQRG